MLSKNPVFCNYPFLLRERRKLNRLMKSNVLCSFMQQNDLINLVSVDRLHFSVFTHLYSQVMNIYYSDFSAIASSPSPCQLPSIS